MLRLRSWSATVSRLPRALVLTSILASLTGCVGAIGDPDGETEDGDGVGTKSNPLCVNDTPIRRMTRFEYDNTVRDLLGDTTRPASGLPPEEETAGFDNQAGALLVSDLLAEKYLDVAEDVSGRAIKDLPKLTGCDAAAKTESVCADEFISKFGKRAFRRPLTDAEVKRFRALFDRAQTDPELADKDLSKYGVGIQLVLEAMLQSPSFLYRPEFGGDSPLPGTDVVALTSYEVAAKLSFMIWNTMPDDKLFAAADADELLTKDQVGAQARRMLEDPRAKDAIDNFHRQWLRIVPLDSVVKDPILYPDFGAAEAALYEEETLRFVEHVILEDDAKLKTLLSADYTFMNKDLADMYGDDVTGERPTGDELVQVSVDPSKRAGLLTHGSLMTTLSKEDRSSPVYRGKFVIEQLLCKSIAPPPGNLMIIPPKYSPELTTREQFEVIEKDGTCGPGCHQRMNPIGYLFEHYDSVGQWRETQNEKTVNSSGSIEEEVDVAADYKDAVDMAHALAESQDVGNCVASQWFRFSYNRTVTKDDKCMIDDLDEAFAKSGYDIRELIVALTQTNTFLNRHQISAEGDGK